MKNNKAARSLTALLAGLAFATVEADTRRDIEAAVPVDVIGAEEFAENMTSVEDILQSLPHVRSDGTTGPNATIRGLPRQEPLVLINGQRVVRGTAAFGQLWLDPALIERVEVLRGPQGSLYGRNATSGIVNTIPLRESRGLGIWLEDNGAASAPIPPSALEQVEVLKNTPSSMYGRNASAGTVNIVTRGNATGFSAAPVVTGEGDPEENSLGALLGRDLYGGLANRLFGSVELDSYCDYGYAPALPGWALSPSLGMRLDYFERYGSTFTIPYDWKAIKPEAAPARDGVPQTPAAPTAGSANEQAPAAEAPTAEAPKIAVPADTRTPLQRWDRGVPPWSLVQRSPECAELLAELEPLYEKRDKAMADYIYYTDYTLSDWQLRENAANAEKARADNEAAKAEIMRILKPCLEPDPPPAATAPTQTAQAQTGTTAAGDGEARGEPGIGALTDAESRYFGFKLRPGLSMGYPSDLWRYYDRLTGDGEAVAGDGAGDTKTQARGGNGFDYNFDTRLYLATKRWLDGGGTEIAPASDGMFDPSYPYANKLSLPFGGIRDTTFNAELGSNRGFADDTGRVRWSLNERDPDPEPEYGHDLTRSAFSYNLKDGWVGYTLEVPRYDSEIVEVPNPGGARVRNLGELPASTRASIRPDWSLYLDGSWALRDKLYLSFSWPEGEKPGDVRDALPGVRSAETNYCAAEAFPALAGTAHNGTAGRPHDRWATRRIGFNGAGDSARARIRGSAQTVTVAVIDTGLDWHHYDLSWNNLWRNTDEIPDNGIDDDANGYVDDVFGWDFVAHANTPWDYDGHGTFVTGLIAATVDNRAGIDGLNPNARIMVLKALNNMGHTRASWMAQAVIYAVDNGARVINLSAAGPGLPRAVQDALDYADANGVLVVVAAGNSARDVSEVAPAGLRHAITVAATGPNNKRAPFSNYGTGVDLAAPGVDVVSLRARGTDFRLTSRDVPYVRDSAIVGMDRRYYRADGTSFAAPLVAGVASLIWSNDPALSHVQVRRMLEQSAADLNAPGRDRFTGYGLLDARAALDADPDFFVLAEIDSVAVASAAGQPVARVSGTVDASEFREARLEIGRGESPSDWKTVGKPIRDAARNAVLGDIPASALQGSPVWTVRVVSVHKNGRSREARYRLDIG